MECRNYIRTLHTVAGNRMYVCGTNAFSPVCDYMVCVLWDVYMVCVYGMCGWEFAAYRRPPLNVSNDSRGHRVKHLLPVFPYLLWSSSKEGSDTLLKQTVFSTGNSVPSLRVNLWRLVFSVVKRLYLARLQRYKYTIRLQV